MKLLKRVFEAFCTWLTQKNNDMDLDKFIELERKKKRIRNENF